MSAQLVPLSSSQHLTHGWKRYDNYFFVANDSIAPVLLAEISAALPYYSLAFARRPGGGCWLVALLGLQPGANLYLTPQGGWQAGYIPCIYLSYPFALATLAGDDQQRKALCFDRSSGLYRETPNTAGGEDRFFTDDGKLCPKLQQIMDFLEKAAINRLLTNRAVDALEAAGLLTDWPLSGGVSVGERPLLQGLMRIDEAALNGLDAQALQQLRNANALTVAYAQLFSMTQLAILRKRAELRAPREEQKPLVSLDELFGESGDDMLRFN